MDKIFKEHYPLTRTELETIWTQCLFVFDANVLLGLYRRTDEIRDQLLALLSHPALAERLWLPHQVVMEFYYNRTKVILEQAKIADQLSSAVNRKLDDVSNEIQQKAPRIHPYIDKTDWLKQIESLKKVLRTKIEHEDERRRGLLSEDHILIRLQSIFVNKVGEAHTNEELPALREEGERRLKERIPPGYADESEKEGDRRLGDFFIWKQMMAEAKRAKRPAILVTDDSKEDWWFKLQGRTVGPRPELRKEFFQETMQLIHFYTFAQFAEYASKRFTGTPATTELRSELRLSSLLPYPWQARFRDFHEPPGDDERSGENERCLELDERDPGDNPSDEEIERWFFRHYEDPANGVPFDSGEGGFQYVNGGPYDPMDVLIEQFPMVSEARLKKIADAIYPQGWEWVKVGQY